MNSEFEQKNKDSLDTPVTVGVLLEYTDEFLIPKVSEIVREEIGAVREEMKSLNGKLIHELKSYIDDKLADYTSDIFKRLDIKYQNDKTFKKKVVELFKKQHLASPEEIAFLEGLTE